VAFRSELEDFGAFYERTYQVAFRTALAIVRDAALAADVTQEAYVSAYEQRHRFRGDAPGQPWLHRIVVNRSLMTMRRHRPSVRQIEPSDANGPDSTPASADRIAILAALDGLTPQQRAAVVLRYYHDYDYATIARILGTTTSNVGAILSRARDRLRNELEPRSAAPAVAGLGR
jgi:RNA polymerase sigma-70 factor, ECF subfamily